MGKTGRNSSRKAYGPRTNKAAMPKKGSDRGAYVPDGKDAELEDVYGDDVPEVFKQAKRRGR